jgi:lipopolysaccharide biosynthesis glycosyltransferase
MNSIWIGFDPREAGAFAVARHTIRKHLTQPIPIYGLVLSRLQAAGLYKRPTQTKVNGDGHVEMVDVLSAREDYDGRISTQHALSRFLVPHVAKTGWALFLDGDMLVRANVARLFAGLDGRKALYCVKHRHEPEASTKMDGQVQTKYERKNWSSFMAFNCDHRANKSLTLDLINTAPGRDLHAFKWLDPHGGEELIGELDPSWNFLVGHSDPSIVPKVAHFTSGTPEMAGYENAPFADEWRNERDDWAHGALSFGV